MLVEKEYYLGVLEAETIKQVEMKRKNEERIFQENQKATRNQTILQEPYQRDKYQEPYQRDKIPGTILKWT